MFNDLTNASLNPIYTQNVKSYPSINSPNSGGFNDEINMKWISKKFTSKPFVVNPKTDFIKKGQTADTLTVTSGSVCVDGYMIKLSSAGNTSFDSETQGTVTFNIQYLQRFVNNLIGNGTDTPIKTKISDILFSEYDPNTVIDDDYTTINENWSVAKTNGSCVGYICIVYKDTYMSELSVSSSAVKYQENSVANKTGNNAYLDIDYNSTPDEIRTAIQNDGTVGFNVGDPFAIVGITSIEIFYPIKPTMKFTEIFGFGFSFSSALYESKLYPYTDSEMIDMETNDTLGTFTNCNLSTLPTHLYDFESLYDSNYERYDVGDAGFPGISYTTCQNPFDNLVSTQSQPNILNKYTLSTLLSTYIPSNYSTFDYRIDEINNELSYYCLDLTGTPYVSNQLSIENNLGNPVNVPVVFLASNGQLCPNGVITGSSNNTYPAEGYLHFIKRNYLVTVGRSTTEENISNVTVSDITSTSKATWATWFSNFYSNVLAKLICAYLQVAHSSILDNVIRYNDAPDPSDPDSKDMKSIGCGVALASTSGVTSDDFETIKSYGFNGYVYNSSTNTFDTNATTVDISYNKDLTSDYKKIKYCLTDNVITDVLTPFNYYKELDITDNDLIALSVEDPIHFLRRCVSTNSSESRVSTKIYKISGSSVVQCSGTNANINNIRVDDNLIPELPTTYIADPNCSVLLRTHQIRSVDNLTKYISATHGICVQFNKYQWSISVPAYLHIYKDGDNYLAGKDFLHPNEYLGCKVVFDIPGQQPENAAFIFNLLVPTESTNVNPDKESKFISVDTTSTESKIGRDAYIEIDRIYDPDSMKTLEEYINTDTEDLTNQIEQLQQTINNLQTYINNHAVIMYYHQRVHLGDDIVAANTPFTHDLQSNSKIALKIDLYRQLDDDTKISITDYSLITYQVTNTGVAIYTNPHDYNPDVKTEYYYSMGDSGITPPCGILIISNNSNSSIDNILFDVQLYKEGNVKDVSCEITTLAAIIFNNSDLTKTLSVNDTYTITPDEIIPSGQTITWVSEDPTVATVNSSTGLITAIAEGTTKITAYIENENAKVSTSCILTVE